MVLFVNSFKRLESDETDENKDSLKTNKTKRRNNIKLLMIHALTFGMFDSICREGGILDNFIFILSGRSNKDVGEAETICGMSEMFAAVVAGLLADYYHNNRSFLLVRYGYLGMILSLLFTLTLYFETLLGIKLCLAIYGSWIAFKDCTSYAVFADSVSLTDRGFTMTRAEGVAQAAAAIGPIVSIIVLIAWSHEDDWTISALKPVLIFGSLGLLIPASTLMFWSDVPHRAQTVGELKDVKENIHVHVPGKRLVPALLCFTDIVSQLGMGMTVKFIPLFFKEEFGLHPINIELIYLLHAVAFVVGTIFARSLSAKYGRVKTSIIYTLGGAISLYLFAYAQSLPAVIALFVIGGALCNAVVPLDRSLVLDSVAAEERGRWAAAEALGSASWSGSAFFGGLLVDGNKGSYRFTFEMTALIYSIALLFRIPLLCLVQEYDIDHIKRDSNPGIELVEEGNWQKLSRQE